MNGPDQYLAAQEKLAQALGEMELAAKGGARHLEASIPLVTIALAAAQVQATLALADAVAGLAGLVDRIDDRLGEIRDEIGSAVRQARR